MSEIKKLPKDHPLRVRYINTAMDVVLWLALIPALGVVVVMGIYALRHIGPVWLWQGMGMGSYLWLVVRQVWPQVHRLKSLMAKLDAQARSEALRIDGEDY